MSIRIYQAGALQSQTVVTLDEKASHHLARVLRASVGDPLILFNGEGGEYAAVITEIKKKNIIAEVKQFIAREVESPIHITLLQGIARGEKMDWIIQKAVELGVNKIIPLITERCNVRLKDEREEKRVQHWQSVIISACEQSGRNKLPELTAPQIFNDCISQIEAPYRFVLSPHVDKKLMINKPHANDHIVLLVGPEGGLSEIEINSAMSHQFMALNLGPRVLRTETAALAAMSMLQSLYGDFC